MIKILQINLNHCEAAQELLSQTVRENKVDLVLISEPYKEKDPSRWISDKSKKAAIWNCGKYAFSEVSTASDGYVRAKIHGINFFSCYAPPSWPHTTYQNMLDTLVEDAYGKSPMVIGGDFNAWATEWGSRKTTARGRSLLESFATLDIYLANDGKTNTFRKAGKVSIIDLTFTSSSLIRHTKWWVSEEYTQSDHQAVYFEITDRHTRKKHVPMLSGPKWKDSSFDKDSFNEIVDSWNLAPGSAENMMNQLDTLLSRACDVAMPRRKPSRRVTPCYWWNDNIKSLRAECLKARRKSQRARGRPNYHNLLNAFRNLRNQLKIEIKVSKTKCFKKLCDEADINPWGTAYRMVMKRLSTQKPPQITCPILLDQIITHLFPRNTQSIINENYDTGDETIPPITEDEVLEMHNRIGESKTPGPDGIPNKALKAAIGRRPDIFRDVIQQCLNEGTFPTNWKLQRLVLLPKDTKSPNEPSSYRPICLLDSMGKMLERAIYKRLLDVAEINGALSQNQFGFRKSRSTVDAIKRVVDTAASAIEGKRWRFGTKEYCAVVTLDVKNAFNSANWDFIMSALSRMNCPRYIRKIIGSYFKDRKLLYDTKDGVNVYNVSAGVPQGSVLGPLLWNVMYDAVLRLNLPNRTQIIGFADDIAIVTVAKHIHEVELQMDAAIQKVRQWLQSANLTLAEQKTEAVLITSRKKIEYINVKVGEQTIRSKPYIKYLGVILDNKLNFKPHVEHVTKKASKVQMTIARMLPNIGGPKPARRILLSKVVSSAILYAAPVWADALAIKETKRRVTSVYRRSALRTISGYRTVSDEAAFVISGMIPIDILADEMKRVYSRNEVSRLPNERRNVKREERSNSLIIWQNRWDVSTKGRWTYRLIPDIATWIRRSQGETNYYLTQFFTGHGGFRYYLHKYGHDSSPLCPSCPGVIENVEHVMFDCERFRSLRFITHDPMTLMNLMIENADMWKTTSSVVSLILMELRRIETERRLEQMETVNQA